MGVVITRMNQSEADKSDFSGDGQGVNKMTA